MKPVIITIETTPTKFPAGTASTGIVITLPGFAPQTITAAPYAAQFDNVPPGTYQATAQAIDAAGAPLGALITSDSFTVDAPPADVMLDIPVRISITVQ